MSELDATPAETTATYQEIKDYIQEKHGIKVSSLYIAQVKEQLGIKERECYNKSKVNMPGNRSVRSQSKSNHGCIAFSDDLK